MIKGNNIYEGIDFNNEASKLNSFISIYNPLRGLHDYLHPLWGTPWLYLRKNHRDRLRTLDKNDLSGQDELWIEELYRLTCIHWAGISSVIDKYQSLTNLAFLSEQNDRGEIYQGFYQEGLLRKKLNKEQPFEISGIE